MCFALYFFFLLFLRSYISQVEAFLLNITTERPWLTAEDFKPVNDRLERLKVLLLPLLPLFSRQVF
jgi:hypothetical protein